jgi:hypothetical protein
MQRFLAVAFRRVRRRFCTSERAWSWLLLYQAAWGKCARRESSFAGCWVAVDERDWVPSPRGSRCCDETVRWVVVAKYLILRWDFSASVNWLVGLRLGFTAKSYQLWKETHSLLKVSFFFGRWYSSNQSGDLKTVCILVLESKSVKFIQKFNPIHQIFQGFHAGSW